MVVGSVYANLETLIIWMAKVVKRGPNIVLEFEAERALPVAGAVRNASAVKSRIICKAQA